MDIENSELTDKIDMHEHTVRDAKNKKIFIGVIVLGIGILALGIFYKIFQTEKLIENVSYTQEVSMEDPVNLAMDFYNPWLEAVRSTSTNPYELGLGTDSILSEKLRARLVGASGRDLTEIDPVLCQTTTPARSTGRMVSQQETVSRVLIMAKEKELTGQSVFILRRLRDGWFIDDILCSPGEFDLPREFTFEKEGYLLMSVPPPFDPTVWHIVFEENGELGHAVPLSFTAESSCIAIDTRASICDTREFIEATKVHVYGQMTESGATVTRLEFIE